MNNESIYKFVDYDDIEKDKQYIIIEIEDKYNYHCYYRDTIEDANELFDEIKNHIHEYVENDGGDVTKLIIVEAKLKRIREEKI